MSAYFYSLSRFQLNSFVFGLQSLENVIQIANYCYEWLIITVQAKANCVLNLSMHKFNRESKLRTISSPLCYRILLVALKAQEGDFAATSRRQNLPLGLGFERYESDTVTQTFQPGIVPQRSAGREQHPPNFAENPTPAELLERFPVRLIQPTA